LNISWIARFLFVSLKITVNLIFLATRGGAKEYVEVEQVGDDETGEGRKLYYPSHGVASATTSQLPLHLPPQRKGM